MATSESPADMALLKRYRSGDLVALETLVARHRRGLFGYIYHTVQSQAEADDVYQEVWMRVIKKHSKFRGGNFGGWLTRIAHNIIIDRVRRRHADLSLDMEDKTGFTIKDHLPDDAVSPAAGIQGDDIRSRVNTAVSELPQAQREVFLMRTQQDMPFKEIARVQGTSINTALARMQYALAKLRDSLEDLHSELQPGIQERRESLSWTPTPQAG